MMFDTFSRFTELGSNTKKNKNVKRLLQGTRQHHDIEFSSAWSNVPTFQSRFQQHLRVHVKRLDPVVI